MEATNILDGSILLFNYYDEESQNLHTSFTLAGINCPAIVVEDDGFVSDDVISILGYYLGDYSQKGDYPGKPLYFNQVVVPDYWEISSNNRRGRINDKKNVRGYINYVNPANKRLVKSVDWLDARGIIRVTNHYNQYGAIYARTAYDAEGKPITKAFLSPEGREVIVENYVTGAIILDDDGQTRIFHSKTEFVMFFFKQTGIEKCRIFYNSLSVPFFVSERLESDENRKDILFWQENIRPDIPGNMQIILEGRANRTERIFVQKKRAYDKLIELGADDRIISKLGYIYPFQKSNRNKPEALICTNSDNIEKLKEIVEGLPEVRFHIAALTEMSSKLMAFGTYSNVRLYPGVREDVLDELFEDCDYYLDINHENEIVNAVCEAFLYNQVIFAFRETVHNNNYIADEHIYSARDVEKMIGDIRASIEDLCIMDANLVLQQKLALAETEYRF